MTKASPIRSGDQFTEGETSRILEQFRVDGYCHLGKILEDDEVATLRDAMERKIVDPLMQEDQPGDHRRGTSLMRMYEYDMAFRDLIVREPFASLAETILGDDCHLMSQNALITPPNPEAKADGPGGWHIDDLVHFPLPNNIPYHDPAIPLPCFVMQIFTPLTDIEIVENGPTQVVPGSHYAGRAPDSQVQPEFKGKKPVSIFARAGEVYMFNNQMWHRGAPNPSDRLRLLGGVTYSKRFVAQKLYPFVDYRMPDHVWEGAGPRLQRFLGRHKKGAYG